jgi:hypothetical protein
VASFIAFSTFSVFDPFLYYATNHSPPISLKGGVTRFHNDNSGSDDYSLTYDSPGNVSQIIQALDTAPITSSDYLMEVLLHLKSTITSLLQGHVYILAIST